MSRLGCVLTTTTHDCYVSTGIYVYCGSDVSSNYVRVTKYRSEETTVYTKGDTYYGEVSSKDNSAFPNEDKSGSYWYVYKGVE